MKIKFWYEKTLLPTKWLAHRIVTEHFYYTGIVFAIIEDNGIYALGITKCSKKDHFNKKIARTIALGRAMKAMDENLLFLPITTSLVKDISVYIDKLLFNICLCPL